MDLSDSRSSPPVSVSNSTIRSFTPIGSAYVLMTSSLPWPTFFATRTVSLCFTRAAILTASPAAEAQSYIELLQTCIPSRSHIMLWYSKSAWSIPWLISGW